MANENGSNQFRFAMQVLSAGKFLYVGIGAVIAGSLVVYTGLREWGVSKASILTLAILAMAGALSAWVAVLWLWERGKARRIDLRKPDQIRADIRQWLDRSNITVTSRDKPEHDFFLSFVDSRSGHDLGHRIYKRKDDPAIYLGTARAYGISVLQKAQPTLLGELKLALFQQDVGFMIGPTKANGKDLLLIDMYVELVPERLRSPRDFWDAAAAVSQASNIVDSMIRIAIPELGPPVVEKNITFELRRPEKTGTGTEP